MSKLIVYDIVLGDTTAAEVQRALDEWMLLHPERKDVHIKRGRCDDCDGKHLPHVKVLRTVKLCKKSALPPPQ
jgi:hypothetical protein